MSPGTTRASDSSMGLPFRMMVAVTQITQISIRNLGTPKIVIPSREKI
jgi:hypothetical protein